MKHYYVCIQTNYLMHDIDFVLKFIFFAVFIPCFSVFLIVLVLNRCAIYYDLPRQSSEIQSTVEDQLPVYSDPPPPEYKLEDFQV